MDAFIKNFEQYPEIYAYIDDIQIDYLEDVINYLKSKILEPKWTKNRINSQVCLCRIYFLKYLNNKISDIDFKYFLEILEEIILLKDRDNILKQFHIYLGYCTGEYITFLYNYYKNKDNIKAYYILLADDNINFELINELTKNFTVNTFLTIANNPDITTFHIDSHKFKEILLENETMKVFPGGPEYQKALEDFNELKN